MPRLDRKPPPPKFAEQFENDPAQLMRLLILVRASVTDSGFTHSSAVQSILVDKFKASEKEAKSFVGRMCQPGDTPASNLLKVVLKLFADSRMKLTPKALELLRQQEPISKTGH